ncbi:MAG TPA: SAF domain-containing protein [Acidimicrobiales bacterium]|nr:SAF domain-containing protein [Acidimicrobiales bacterium]
MTTLTTRNGSAAQRSDRPRIDFPADTHRRPVRALALVAVVIACALGFAVTLATAGHRQAVLAVAREVPAGAVIRSGDLTVVKIAADRTLRPVPATELGRVVGRTAAVALVPGTLVTKAQLDDRLGPAPGESVVGVVLKGARTPPASLRAGQRVDVVQTTTPVAGDATSTGQLGTVVTEGRVLGVESSRAGDDAVNVSLAVDAGVAPAVAGAAAADQLSIVVQGPGR